MAAIRCVDAGVDLIIIWLFRVKAKAIILLLLRLQLLHLII